MALRSGLIGNSVIQGLLGGGINNIRNASFQKANAARPQSQAVRLGTKGAIVTKGDTGQGLSMLAKGLSDIAAMRKEKAAKETVAAAGKALAGGTVPAFRDPDSPYLFKAGGTANPDSEYIDFNDAKENLPMGAQRGDITDGLARMANKYQPGTFKENILVPERTGRQAAIQTLLSNPDTAPMAMKMLMQKGDVIGSTESGFYRTDPAGGPPKQLIAPVTKPVKPTARDQKVAQYRDAYPELSKQEILKLVDPPKVGNTTKIEVDTAKLKNTTGYQKLESIAKPLRENANASALGIRNLDTLNNLLTSITDADLTTGVGSEAELGIKSFFGKFGINFKGTAALEGFRAFTNKAVLPQLKKLGQNPTNVDLKFVVDSEPTLGKTVAGNKLLIQAGLLANKFAVAQANFANKWQMDNMAVIDDNPYKAALMLERAVNEWNLSDEAQQFTLQADQIREAVMSEVSQDQQMNTMMRGLTANE